MKRVCTLCLCVMWVSAAAKAVADSSAIPAPVMADWAQQDGLQTGDRINRDVVVNVIASLEDDGAELRREHDLLKTQADKATDDHWLTLYRRACLLRRASRLKPHAQCMRRIVFTKHANLGGSHYAYTEAQSDAQAERHFKPGAALCLLELDGLFGNVRTLLEDRGGMIRDPDVSFDGRRILFAWKQSDRKDDFHLYEMNTDDGKIRQLTAGLGVADYEPAYLPNGDIVFNSTRCVQTVDCWWTEVSNLYTCDKDGRFLRRLTFDQVHDNFPTVTDDGRVIYTRWDYNDRGQIFPQGLFQMNPDGTAQRALYGNNSYFPTTILHARAIPKSGRYVAILTGHHTHQRGQLALIDPGAGRQENSGVQLIAPRRAARAERIDAYGQSGPQFQHPYPLSESAFLVSMDPKGSDNQRYDRPYAIYLITAEGQRELLAWDEAVSCNQPMPLAARPTPPVHASVVDYSQTTGTFYVHDVYAGMGLRGVERGTIKSLRVVALDFRAAGIGRNHNRGAAGGALVSTPVSIGNGSWDVKTVLGEAPVQADGSAFFEAPARTPIYFQALDRHSQAVQTMRSWVTLQPGEAASCVGCHDRDNTAPLPTKPLTSLALQREATRLDTSKQHGFSFRAQIQPILNAHCTQCHRDRTLRMGDAATEAGIAFSLLDEPVDDGVAKRRWNDAYVNLLNATGGEGQPYMGRANDVVRWLDVQSGPAPLPPYTGGAAQSRLLSMLREGHHGVKLKDAELRLIACWIDLLVPFCGDYTETNLWSDAEAAKYRHFLEKRRRLEQADASAIRDLIGRSNVASHSADAPKPTSGAMAETDDTRSPAQ